MMHAWNPLPPLPAGHWKSGNPLVGFVQSALQQIPPVPQKESHLPCSKPGSELLQAAQQFLPRFVRDPFAERLRPPPLFSLA